MAEEAFDQKDRARQWIKDKRQEAALAGLCIECRKVPTENGKVRCTGCAIKSNERAKKSIANKKSRELSKLGKVCSCKVVGCWHKGACPCADFSILVGDKRINPTRLFCPSCKAKRRRMIAAKKAKGKV